MATKSSVISGMGVAMSLVQSLVGAVKKAGGTDEDIHRLTTPEANGVWEKIAQAIVHAGRRFGEVFPVVVDYSRSLKDSIAAGCYDWVNSGITQEHFPAEKDEQGTKEQSFTLYHFGEETESNWVIAQMDRDGKRPATIRELLAFGEANPEFQGYFPVIALKSVWVCRGGDHACADIGSRSGKRYLDLNWYNHRWHGNCRFLAVSK